MERHRHLCHTPHEHQDAEVENDAAQREFRVEQGELPDQQQKQALQREQPAVPEKLKGHGSMNAGQFDLQRFQHLVDLLFLLGQRLEIIRCIGDILGSLA